ncbi:transmembrane protein 132C [Xyrichtys novacula]|uniref:Transmembrane protein 132C n=1 Tax=Xyrichtys novacula TaxID=13765 RepID=A0AAV1GF84_XYRNO|nr:transmembrane protein 132C [Xyrichtys novacula]
MAFAFSRSMRKVNRDKGACIMSHRLSDSWGHGHSVASELRSGPGAEQADDGGEVTWQLGVSTLTCLGGIVLLAMDTEILNTAAPTEQTISVPEKVVTMRTDGALSDVTEAVESRSNRRTGYQEIEKLS